MIRNGTGENLCDVSATIVSDFKEIRPITVRLAVLNPYEARQFVQEIGAGEQFSAAFRIDRVTCRVCTPAQLDKEVKSLPQGKPPADDPKSTGSTPLFPK
jgi:hypothetical protein